ncbi:MAG: hypothetical protein N2110_01025 [Flavobacteriales bacterium]|nr:hypothetical protein [Flavobacteriales bacterium]MCX7767592.1 hypothetical protein [Flavobacteriales bacterium]MDW8410236.1 hypothetical protein [Flavobacteriales bacterium]
MVVRSTIEDISVESDTTPYPCLDKLRIDRSIGALLRLTGVQTFISPETKF